MAFTYRETIMYGKIHRIMETHEILETDVGIGA